MKGIVSSGFVFAGEASNHDQIQAYETAVSLPMRPVIHDAIRPRRRTILMTRTKSDASEALTKEQ